ncbi:cupin domain-containing protein [Rhodohalobacter sp.]|uniref:cupin domain-containing protein n=1 Tax=Rhodohalobacter sp. TaxID=1974210 RepID=UPI002ACDCF30|nr:cupin domain-containing protein [Rhodohalobacter sp.]MDZ7758137.1 cupin domain-containing protein [Rhodohalobacter sp.]
MHILKTISIFTFILLFPLTLLSQNSSSDDREAAIVTGIENENLHWTPCPEFMPESCRISVLHGNPANPNADVFFKLQGHTSVPEHTHTSAERMILISGELEVDYEGQQPSLMTAGDYGYGPPQKPHSASCVSDEPCVLFIAFEEPVDAFPVSGQK